MFPLNWNIPFIRKNGSRTTLGAITGDIAGLTDKTEGLWDNMKNNGAVNMFDNILTAQVVNGITYTVNDDKSVTCNGTATANGGVMLGGIAVKSGKAYKISGCPSGGDADNSYALIVRATNITSADVIGSDIGNGFIYTPTSDTTVYLQIRFANGQTPNNLTFKPMITVPSYNGDYVPYAKSNRELTEEKLSLSVLKSVVADSSDFADFKTKIAAL